MGTLSKVAAGAAAVIPFHCVICFDEFNLSDRVPMVLPCGHTYVCHRCTKRLNRCMECREPLFMSVPSSAFTNASASSASSASTGTTTTAFASTGRYSPLSIPSHGPPPPMVKIPLAIPKNVVLISLMEAAQRQKVDDKLTSTSDKLSEQPKRRQDADDDDDDDDSSVGSDQQDDDDSEEFDLDRIISGMATFTGPCGTYAVTVNHHVVVQPNDPRVHAHQQQQHPPSLQQVPVSAAVEGEEKKSDDPAGNGDVGSVVVVDAVADPVDDSTSNDDAIRPISQLSTAATESGTHDDDETETEAVEVTATATMEVLTPKLTSSYPEPFVLRKGQTVQVVELEDGVAKLARGMGYIVLGATSHLVKVGGPLDPVCRLEGLLGTIEGRGKDLQATLDENRQVEDCLRNQIQDEMMKTEPRHPVITEVDELDDDWRNDDNNQASDSDDDEDRIRGKNKENVMRPAATTPTGSSGPTASSSALGYQPTTPDSRRRDSGSHHSLTGSIDSIDSRAANVHTQQSPMSIDNADLHRGGAAIPVYRRTVSEDDIDQLVFGCGVAFLGGDATASSSAAAAAAASGIFSGAPNILGNGVESGTGGGTGGAAAVSGASTSSSYASSVLAARPRSATDHHFHSHHDYGGPTLTSSFDGIDFRTGMSGHRGLNHLHTGKPSSSHYSPTPRYRTMRLMSEHRGIARPLSSSSRRESPTSGLSSAAAASAAAGVPAFGPRLSPFPQQHVVGGGDDASGSANHQYR